MGFQRVRGAAKDKYKLNHILVFCMLSAMVLHLVLMVVFAYALYLGYTTAKKMYGGRLTSVLPPFVGAIALMFFMHAFELVFSFTPAHDAEFLHIGMQMLQLVAGLLFITGLNQLYQVGFATSGFWEAKK